MAEYRVRAGGQGEGGTLPTLAAAVAVVKAGDVVHIEPGVYAPFRPPAAGTTWLGQPGAIIDGGWKGNELTTAQDDAAGILIKAAGVTVRGLEVRNVPGNGVAVGEGGHDFTLEDCEISDCYHGGFKANPTAVDEQGRLKQLIAELFDAEEIATLAFDLGLSRSLKGDTPDERARALVGAAGRRGKLDKLTSLARQERPDGGF